MPNVTELFTLRTQSAYLSDGVRQALEGLIHFIPRALKVSDNISFYSNDSVSTAPIDIDTGAGSRPLVVVVESRGSSGQVRFYNQAGSASVTGSDELAADVVVPIASTTGEVTAVSLFGDAYATLWTAGLVVATTAATSVGTARTAMTSTPRIYLLYVNA